MKKEGTMSEKEQIFREDLRLAISETKLIGWTVLLVKSILPELILRFSNEEEFLNALKNKKILKGKSWKEYLQSIIEDPLFALKDELSENLETKYKDEMSRKTLDMKYSEIEKIILPYRERIKEFFADPNNKALVETKAVAPIEWMFFKGRVEPGETGATRTLPGFFVPLDSGRVEFLAQKPFFHEYYLHGEILNGKFVLTKLFIPKKWRKAGPRRMVWMLWKTLPDDLPYVISRRAVKKKWMPPDGKSALPEFIRNQIPKEYQYWRHKGVKARKIRDELVDAIKRKELIIKPIQEMDYSRIHEHYLSKS